MTNGQFGMINTPEVLVRVANCSIMLSSGVACHGDVIKLQEEVVRVVGL